MKEGKQRHGLSHEGGNDPLSVARVNSPAEQILPMGITVSLGKKVRTGA